MILGPFPLTALPITTMADEDFLDTDEFPPGVYDDGRSKLRLGKRLVRKRATDED